MQWNLGTDTDTTVSLGTYIATVAWDSSSRRFIV